MPQTTVSVVDVLFQKSKPLKQRSYRKPTNRMWSSNFGVLIDWLASSCKYTVWS
jgi:hypothetical protein